MRYFLIVLILICFSCEKTIPYDEETFEDRIVVNGLLIAGDSINVKITKSLSILSDPFDEDGFENLNNCSVKLFDNDILIEELSEGEAGVYQFDQMTESDHTYRLEVSHAILPEATCETKVPGAVVISSAIGVDIENDFSSRITMSWNDNEAASYYQALLYRDFAQGQTPSYNLDGWSTTSPYFDSDPLNDNGESYFYADAVFLDELFENSTAQLDLDTYSGGSQETDFQVALLGCSESYFLYKSTLRAYYQSDGGLFAQPVQIYSNVEGGFGIFGSASMSVVDVEF